METMGLSKDRRRFIVISIFDASFVTLLWLLHVVTVADDWKKTILRELNIFEPTFIHNSLFDVVLCAFFRMLVLIIIYAVMVVKQWYPVALTTSITSLFLIIKVLLYFTPRGLNGPIQYLIVLASFIIAWFELWLMPFRVLRRERRGYVRHQDSEDDDYPEVLAHPPRTRAVERLTARSHQLQSTDDEANFRSALEFSSDEEHYRRNARHQPQIPAMMREIYEKAIYEAENRTKALLVEARRGTWKVLRAERPMVLQGPDQSYFIGADFPCSPAALFDAVWKDVLKWNPQVLQGKSLLSLDKNTELFHSISAPAMKGYISSRDFLDVRRIVCDPEKNEFTGVFISVESTLCPANANKKIVRGSNGPSVFRATEAESPSESRLEWIMKTDLRGGLPKRLVQSSMLNYFCEHMDRLHKYVEGLDNRMTG